MTATDELRKLLDERGMEHDDDYLRLPKDNFSKYTTWGDDDCNVYIEYADGTVLRIFDCTPEQAIAATLGEADEGCYLMRDGKKFPVELDYGFLGIMPITIKVGGFRYLLEVPDGE